MEIIDERIDGGKAFDWGKTSKDYAMYRDIYPDIFYQKIVDRGLCIKGQNVLDLGTGTGVLPRNMYYYGATWTGTDISPEQIEQAEQLANNRHLSALKIKKHIPVPVRIRPQDRRNRIWTGSKAYRDQLITQRHI